MELSRWSRTSGGIPAEPKTAGGVYRARMGVVAEVVPNGKALSRAQELAELYLKAPEVTRRNLMRAASLRQLRLTARW